MTNMTVSERTVADLKSAVAWQKLAIAERDRRIAELEGALAKLGDVEQYGTGRAFGLYCDVMVFAHAALAGKGVSRG